MLAVLSYGLLKLALSFLLLAADPWWLKNANSKYAPNSNLNLFSAKKIYMMSNILDVALINKIQVY